MVASPVAWFVVSPLDGALAYQRQPPYVLDHSPPNFVAVELYEPDRPLSDDGTSPNPRAVSSYSDGRGFIIAGGGPWLYYQAADGLTHLWDQREPFSAANPSPWTPELPADARESSLQLIADGWLVRGAYRSPSVRFDLFVFDLEDARNETPVFSAADVSTGYASISEAGLLWSSSDGAHVYFAAAPFAGSSIIDLGPGGYVEMSGGYGYFLDGRELFAIDAARLVAGEPGPVALGSYSGPQRPSISSEHLAWTHDDQVYLADLSSPMPEGVPVSDPSLDHGWVTVGPAGLAWVRCNEGQVLAFHRPCAEGEYRGVGFYSFVTSVAPIVLNEGPDPVHDFSISSIGVAWIEGEWEDEDIYFFDPTQAIVPGVNPALLTPEGRRDSEPVLTDDALYWYLPWTNHTLMAIDSATLLRIASGAP